MRAYNVSLQDVFNSVKMSNLDVGARTIEINQVEYVIRGLGFIKNISDIENSVIKTNDNVPIYIKNIGNVTLGPALRRGVLDKGGAEAVGGVVVVRYGENPLAAIKRLKIKIEEISPGLPKKTLADGRVSQVKIVPFYDRTGLINETLDTLKIALTDEILVTIIVVLLMLMNFRSSLLISGLLPLAVLMSFIGMKYFNVDANIVALSGIAIAIGTMVDMGIVIVENIIAHLEKSKEGESKLEVVYRASTEVGGAVLTAVATTVVSFLPVFTMIAAEGKLFKPLAFTKTFALIASIIVALVVIPPFAHLILTRDKEKKEKNSRNVLILRFIGAAILFIISWWAGLIVLMMILYRLTENRLQPQLLHRIRQSVNWVAVLIVGFILTKHWLPLGPEKGVFRNFLFVGLLIGGLLGFFFLFKYYYPRILAWNLNHKKLFTVFVVSFVLVGMMCWLGFNAFFGWLPDAVRRWEPVAKVAHLFPGFGKEFMPPLDEGSFLYMPTTMPHASIGEALDVLRKQDMGFDGIPEVEQVVGKLGRADTPLDPAPISMFETVINYKPRYLQDEDGHRLQFRFDSAETDFFRDVDGVPLNAPDGKPYIVQGKYLRDEEGKLVPDSSGYPFRLWRLELDPELNPDRKAWAGIQSPRDIWDEILKAGKIPGSTSAPMLQPIATRLIMMQSGMRAPMGIKVKGPDLETIEKVGLEMEAFLKEVPSVEPSAVIADRIIGKPYLEIGIDRHAIARYGIHVETVQSVIEVAVGGKNVTTTVEGRERYPVRVRYMRELRNNLDALKKILVPAPGNIQIPLGQLATINYVRGPQVIKSEDTALVGYVLFDSKPGYAEVDVVETARNFLKHKISTGELVIPAGVNYSFAGNYENQERSEKTLVKILPIALLIIFLLLYFQFKKVSVTGLVFSGIFVAWAGGFIMLWLYGQSWFMDFSMFGMNMRELFQVSPINLSVAVWVGFLALFGIASDDGVIIATYLNQSFDKNKPGTVEEIREATIEAGKRRIKPMLMTTATTILALLPVLTSTGRGADIMVPMAIPSFGGMFFQLITLFVVPVYYCWIQEAKVKRVT
jgi:Cu(I)/Ag(I) efflux system membrane protein CusA/SilA